MLVLTWSAWEMSLKRATSAEALVLGVPYLWTMSLRMASVHFMRASSEAVQDDMMWSRLPQPLHLLGKSRPPRPPRLVLPPPPCDPRPTAPNAKMGGGGRTPRGGTVRLREFFLHVLC
jgi:hypothetical protein